MYGENGTRLRQGLTELLRHHRIQQQLGGAGAPMTARTSPEERAKLGLLIRTYRHSVVVWCHQTAHAVDPYTVSNVARGPANPFAETGRELGPLDALKRSLDAVRARSPARLPTLEELTTPHQVPLVEAWRQTARAAVLTEHDVHAGPGAGTLSVRQAQAVVADIAVIAQALIVLDKRYVGVQDWEPLRHSDRLGWAALACALDASLGAPDYSVDQEGWRPRVKLLRGPTKPGILGVLQAEHNLLVRLNTYPSAANLRLVVDSQRLLAAGLARHADGIDPDLAERWRRRSSSYAAVQKELREIGGLLGRGGLAASEGANAVGRLRDVPIGTVIESRVFAGFHTLFTRIDRRIADIIDSAVSRGHFYERTRVRDVAPTAEHLLRPLKDQYVPVRAATQARLHELVQHRLRTQQDLANRSTTEARSRAELHAGLAHRPAPRPSPPEGTPSL